MIHKLLAGALCALAVVTSAAAADEAPAAAPATAPTPAASPPPAADGNEVICKNVQHVGTRFPQRVCMTRAEREARALNDRKTLESIQRNGTNPQQ